MHTYEEALKDAERANERLRGLAMDRTYLVLVDYNAVMETKDFAGAVDLYNAEVKYHKGSQVKVTLAEVIDRGE